MSSKGENTISPGLDALFNAHITPISDLEKSERIYQIELERIYPSALQPRKTFSNSELDNLASSIKVHGILQPLILRKKEQGFEIIAGERRWRAAKIAGLETVPAIIRDVDDKTFLSFAIIENLQREDLNIIEEANALRRLIDEFGMTHEQVGNLVGRSRTLITNTLRLLNLPDSIKKMLSEKALEMGHARAILTLSEELQLETAEKVIKHSLSVREAERMVKRINEPVVAQDHELTFLLEQKLQNWKSQFSDRFPNKINIYLDSQGKGKLVIHFKSIEEADALVKELIEEPSGEIR